MLVEQILSETQPPFRFRRTSNFPQVLPHSVHVAGTLLLNQAEVSILGSMLMEQILSETTPFRFRSASNFPDTVDTHRALTDKVFTDPLFRINLLKDSNRRPTEN